MTFEEMWAELAPIGRGRGGGYFRQPFTSAEREAHAWFLVQCRSRGLTTETDAFGNTIAWWAPSSAASTAASSAALSAAPSAASEGAKGTAATDAVLTGSHLDSVVDGGGYDGALGVVSALAAVDAMTDRGVQPARPLGIVAFAEEEGSRFGRACLGSRLATGVTSWAEARGLKDADGVAVGDVLDGSDEPAAWWRGAAAFVELHVEQGRDLVHRGTAVGLGSGIWPHGRYRFEFTGEANHAGTTRMEDRRDPMLSYAMTVLAANKQARLADQRATFGRVQVRPNGTNAVPSEVIGWLDARASTTEELLGLVANIERLAVDRGGRDGTTVVVTPESVSPAVVFDAELTARLGEGRSWPVIPTAAGHDAGILAGAGVPTAMLFVRNPTGISHSPEEHAEPGDCLAGVEALADVLSGLVT